MKTITQNQMTGETGEALVKSKILQLGLVYHSLSRLESGEDGLIEMRDSNSGATSPQFIAVQIKTRIKGQYTREDDQGFEYLMDERDLKRWQKSNIPIIIVFYRLKDDSVYWKSILDHVSDDERRLRFDKSKDCLQRSSVDAIASLMVDRTTPGWWIPPLNGGENVILNMFRVVMPEKIIVAQPANLNGRAPGAAISRVSNPRFDWSIRRNRFIAFHDPRGQSSELLVKPNSVKVVDTVSFINAGNQDDSNEMAFLLRKCLERQFKNQLTFRKHKKRSLLMFYSETPNASLEYSYHSAFNKAKSKVVSVHMQKNYSSSVAYVRHHAFFLKFEHIGDDWFLVVEPTFFFTYDGHRTHRSAEALLSGKKRLENNSAIRGQVLMWQHLLCRADQDHDINLPFLEAIREPAKIRFELAPIIDLPVATPDAAWGSTFGSDQVTDDARQSELI